jgi:hypothetical protein
MKGDLALISINQEIVELEKLASIIKTHEKEADFNAYESDLIHQINRRKNKKDRQ